jgi:hypothetical protein
MSMFTRSALAALCLGSMLAAPAAQAGPWGRDGYGPRGAYGYRGGYWQGGHRHGHNVAGAVAAGAALGIVGGAIIASQARRDRDAAAAAYYGSPSPYYGY